MRLNLRERVSRWYQGCKRVIRVSHKPNRVEYLSLIKVIGFGMVGIGVIGLLMNLLFTYFGLFE